ncbi:alpha-mannosidase [Companilactobacillus huachuanensis]|uniref:Alpha-mannosidase n=1 Tax=Companilactobacillus huachuanensis TaxID=2559914 RepID=A0ABW1RN44_9LACO|nr:alpha-mannosidase [Companilactobacillus huachuanensis]
MKKKVFVVSHSHWDREWYMGYEHHHMRLVKLMDDLLDLFKREPDFNSFHLDGQTIILDDYLQVRPEKEAEIKALVKQGKLQIGPFYILQDDFLISGEANARDMLIGNQDSKKWGKPVDLGYFPDTFGNMGQTAQMLKLADLKYAAFGRGVKPTGLNNQVFDNEKYTSQYSEMWWKGPDDSKVLSILFANWYSNGNEIPVDKVTAKKYWDEKLADVEKYASTDNLLMMNGVDHQPVQQDVIEALQVAQELYPDYEFIHSNFDDYLTAVSKSVPADLGSVDGELTSQETDGWYTLANTASSRVYLKQANTKVERQLENIAEPLATIAYDSKKVDYPHDQLRYAWKTLLQNNPHDSICGCSVDEVHREMMTRFEKSQEVGQFVAKEALDKISSQIDTTIFPEDSKPFVLINTNGYEKSELKTVEIEWERALFADGRPDAQFEKMKMLEQELPALKVINAKGEIIPFNFVGTQVRFGYDLPKTQFRIPYMALYVTVQVNMSAMPAFAWETLALVKADSEPLSSNESPLFNQTNSVLENDYLQVVLKHDGSLDILDKKTNHQYNDQLILEDTGDIGNEYIYRQSADQKTILSADSPAAVKIISNNSLGAEIELIQTMNLPVSADERLAYEQQAVIDITKRIANRSERTVPVTFTTTITMSKDSDQLNFKTSFNNQVKDHRVRVLFKTNLKTDNHVAESIYEVVERLNNVNDTWKNPTNPQHEQAFVNVHDDNNGVTVGNFGLNEYEILPDDNTIAITLLRCTGEMGDWGYFETPEAQCLGEYSGEYSLTFQDGSEGSQIDSYQKARNNQVDIQSIQTGIHSGNRKPVDAFITLIAENLAITSLKQSEDGKNNILRGYNLTNKESNVESNMLPNADTVNFLEESIADRDVKILGPVEIRTYKF